MLVIRLFRIGKINQPSFKIVVTDKKNPPKSGRFLETVGSYSPLTKKKNLKIERIKYWLSKGAQPSDTVYNLLVSEKILKGKKIDVHKKPKKGKETTPVKTVPAVEEKVEVPKKPAVAKDIENEGKKEEVSSAASVKEDVSSAASAKEEKPAEVNPVSEAPKTEEKQQ